MIRKTMRSVCNVFTLAERASQIPKSSRTLSIVCAKIAHAHTHFGRLIAESVHAAVSISHGVNMNAVSCA